MSRTFASLAVAFGCAVALNAQQPSSTTTTKTQTETKAGEAKTVVYSGCMQTGTEPRSFVLAKVTPVGRASTGEVGTSGSTTSYMLVPAEKVELQTHMNKKVEVTGMMIPAGQSKTETTTRTEREGAPDTTKQTTKTESTMPQFRVISIKTVADSCS
jgi:hypothetical protein